MRLLERVLLAACFVAVSVSTAVAQGDRRVGVVMAFPGSVGVEWQAADNIAVRLDGDFNRSKYEAVTRFGLEIVPVGTVPVFDSFEEITTTTTSSSIGLGISVLIDLHRSDELRLYLAPRAGVRLSRVTMATDYDGDPARLAALTFAAERRGSSTDPEGGVALGASRDLGERFRVFGEAGLAYSRSGVGFEDIDDQEVSVLSLRAGVGVVIRF